MALPSNWNYVLVATCKDQTIKMFGQKVTVGKEEVACVVVVLDIVICFVFWFALLAMKPLQDAVR